MKYPFKWLYTRFLIMIGTIISTSKRKRLKTAHILSFFDKTNLLKFQQIKLLVNFWGIHHFGHTENIKAQS